MEEQRKKLRLEKALDVILDIFSIIIVYISMTVFVGSVVWLLTYAGEGMSKNVFMLNSASDYFIIGLWLLSGVTPVILLLLKRKKKIILKSYHLVLIIFELVVFFPSAIFMFFKKDNNSIEYISKVIDMTKIYFAVLLIFLLIGIGISLYLTKDSLKKNNWWLFILLIPYILVGWSVQKDFINYNNFVTSSDFNLETVRKMLIETNGDIWLINDFFYKGIAIPILILIILLGMMISENIWKKTRKKRKKTKERNENNSSQNT